MKVTPDELKEAVDDLDQYRTTHANVLTAEPILKKYIDDAAHFAHKRHDEIVERNDKAGS